LENALICLPYLDTIVLDVTCSTTKPVIDYILVCGSNIRLFFARGTRSTCEKAVDKFKNNDILAEYYQETLYPLHQKAPALTSLEMEEAQLLVPLSARSLRPIQELGYLVLNHNKAKSTAIASVINPTHERAPLLCPSTVTEPNAKRQ
jgi:hypothetical protein